MTRKTNSLGKISKAISEAGEARRKYQASKEGITDRIGQIDAALKAMQEEREKLVAKLLKREPQRIEGQHFKAKVFDCKSTWLDHGKVKRRLGATEYAKCFKSKVSRQVRVTPIGEASEDE